MAHIYAPIALSIDLNNRGTIRPKNLQVVAMNDLLNDLYDLELVVKAFSWDKLQPLNTEKIKIEKLVS
jgi:hypothetical protein